MTLVRIAVRIRGFQALLVALRQLQLRELACLAAAAKALRQAWTQAVATLWPFVYLLSPSLENGT